MSHKHVNFKLNLPSPSAFSRKNKNELSRLSLNNSFSNMNKIIISDTPASGSFVGQIPSLKPKTNGSIKSNIKEVTANYDSKALNTKLRKNKSSLSIPKIEVAFIETNTNELNENKLSNLKNNRRKSYLNSNSNNILEMMNNNNNKRVSKFNQNKNQPSQRTQNVQPLLYNKTDEKTLDSDSHFISMINIYKNLLQQGTKNSKFFISTEVLNKKEEENEKFNLEKILKINSFCENLESMEVDLNNFRYTVRQNLMNTEEIRSFDQSEDVNKNVIKIASERRCSVYENLMQNIKNNFDEIMHITNLEERKSDPVSYKSDTTLIDCHITGSDGSMAALDAWKQRQIVKESPRKIIREESDEDKSKQMSIVSNPSEGSCSSSLNRSFSSSNDCSSVNEGLEEKILIPTSKIKNVRLEKANLKILRRGLVRFNTRKDRLIHNENVKKKITTMTDKLDKNSSVGSDNSITSIPFNKENSQMFESLASSQIDVSVFLQARKELEFHSRNNSFVIQESFSVQESLNKIK